MPAPTITQTSTDNTGSATPYSKTVAGVTAGSTLVVCWFYNDSNVRIFEIYDDQSNTWLITNRLATSNRQFGMAVAKNVAAGNTEITIASNASAAVDHFVCFELSACDIDQFDVFERNSDDTTHYAAQSGGIDVAADSIVISCGQHNASGGTLTKDTDYTLTTSDTQWIVQYRSTTSVLSGERPSWTSSTSRNCAGMTMSLSDLGAGGGGGSSTVIVLKGQ